MQLSDLDGKVVTLWGAGREAGAVVRAAQRLGIHPHFRAVIDGEGPSTFEGVDVTSGLAGIDLLTSSDVVVRSPGVSRYRPEMTTLRERGVATTTATNLWFAEEHAPVIGVTGTKGKSTTSSLIAALLNGIGQTAQLAGNIGRAPIDFMGEPEPLHWVLELSSFQCSDIDTSPDIGVLTSLSVEHLDWHGSRERYVDDKLNLFRHNLNIKMVVNALDIGAADAMRELPNVVAAGRPGAVHIHDEHFVVVSEPLFPVSALRLAGFHNRQLACLALSAVMLSGVDLHQNKAALATALSTFEALPHRLCLIDEHNGVAYVDDSLSTTPVATLAALEAFSGRPTTLLIGGHDRGLDYGEFAETVVRRTDPTLLITMPDNGNRISAAVASALGAHPTANVQLVEADDLGDAVRIAVERTPKGGAVLLSPGAASFGRFKDYADRGRQFGEHVRTFTAGLSPA